MSHKCFGAADYRVELVYLVNKIPRECGWIDCCNHFCGYGFIIMNGNHCLKLGCLVGCLQLCIVGAAQDWLSSWPQWAPKARQPWGSGKQDYSELPLGLSTFAAWHFIFCHSLGSPTVTFS